MNIHKNNHKSNLNKKIFYHSHEELIIVLYLIIRNS